MIKRYFDASLVKTDGEMVKYQDHAAIVVELLEFIPTSGYVLFHSLPTMPTGEKRKALKRIAELRREYGEKE